MEAIFSFLSSHYPTIGIILVVVFIVYKATMYHVSIQNTQKKVNNLPCESHRKAIVNIEKSLLNKKKFKAYLTVAYSPRKLSELGDELYQKSGMKVLLNANMDHFVGKIENEKPIAALDVEDLAYSVLYNETSEPIFKPVKDWLFNNPVFRELDIDLSAICYVASIELRDVYLKKHPDILPENDKN